MRFLIVEDDLRLARVIKRGLTQDGHAVDLSVTGDGALGRVRTVVYDAIVLDVMLPGMTASRSARPCATPTCGRPC